MRSSIGMDDALAEDEHVVGLLMDRAGEEDVVSRPVLPDDREPLAPMHRKGDILERYGAVRVLVGEVSNRHGFVHSATSG
jgi:hypothetical protein